MNKIESLENSLYTAGLKIAALEAELAASKGRTLEALEARDYNFEQHQEALARIAALEAERDLAQANKRLTAGVLDALRADFKELEAERDVHQKMSAAAILRNVEMGKILTECYDWMANNGAPGRLLRQTDAALARIASLEAERGSPITLENVTELEERQARILALEKRNGELRAERDELLTELKEWINTSDAKPQS